ncbi:MAG: integrase core domain-containing protein [Actinomycetota bacterium]|nr:integrase core domain-containing protein [Actinomycetota bacterium]
MGSSSLPPLHRTPTHLTFPGKTFYQLTAIDSKTRIKFIRAHAGSSSKSSKLFFADLKAFLPFPILNVQTDNGADFLKCFDKELEKEAIPHYFSDPNCPKQNSRVERAIQTSENELWNFKEGHTVEELNGLADEWNHIYNHVRLHQSLNYLTPIKYCYSKSLRVELAYVNLLKILVNKRS